ncbi:hypothetical protein OROGR_002578 [Orobanche gracilis]
MPLSNGEQDDDSTLIKRRRLLNNRYKKLGDRVDDFKDLLFNQSRDFLVKYNSQLIIYIVSFLRLGSDFEGEEGMLKEKSGENLSRRSIWKARRIESRLSLKGLLASPERDYVINNKWHKVSICDLEDKMVALYLYEEGYAESFKKVFETMPWLALPFKDTNCKKVQRVFLYPFGLNGPHPNHSLVIVGPSREFIESFGAGTVLKNFGIEAYPFAREKAQSLHVQKVKNVKLDMLWGPEAVFMRGYVSESTYQEFLFSNINVGQRIIVFRDTEDVWHREFRMKLQKMYLERKGSNDEFEVLHIGLRRGTVPWLTVHPDFSSRESDAIKVLYDIFCNAYGVLFFDLDGKVVRAAMIPQFQILIFPSMLVLVLLKMRC